MKLMDFKNVDIQIGTSSIITFNLTPKIYQVYMNLFLQTLLLMEAEKLKRVICIMIFRKSWQ